MTVAALTPLVRKALGVSQSYDDEDIPALIRRCIVRLLRDYHFPKSVVRQSFPLVLGQQSVALAEGFKKDLGIRFYNPNDFTWSEPLSKADGFRLPQDRGHAAYYWLEGELLYLDTPITNGWEVTTLELWFESTLVSLHENWFTADFEDLLFCYTVFRGSTEYRKPEVAKIFGPLWADDRASLAVYVNELEFSNISVEMKERRPVPIERYPTS